MKKLAVFFGTLFVALGVCVAFGHRPAAEPKQPSPLPSAGDGARTTPPHSAEADPNRAPVDPGKVTPPPQDDQPGGKNKPI